MRKKLFKLFLFVSSIFLLGNQAGTAAQREIVFIVNSANPAKDISRQEIGDFFLKRSRHWPDNTVVRFIDQKDGSPQREVFLISYLKKSSRETDLFWIGEKLYTGDSAPMQVPNDAAAAALVKAFKGGISYVSSDFAIPNGVKTVTVVGD